MNDLDIFKRGLENEEYSYNLISMERDKKTPVKIILFIISGVIFSRYQNIEDEELAWVNGNRGYEKFFEAKDLRIIHHGSFFANIKNFIHYTSVFTPIPRWDRLKILFSVFKQTDIIKQKSFWLEFIFIKKFIEYTRPKEICTVHLYDRQISWISMMAREMDIKLVIYQHGVVSPRDKIPNKIFCGKLFYINKKQLEYLENIIYIEHSVIERLEYVSLVKFVTLQNENQFKIGIATQVNAAHIINITSRIQATPELKDVQIYLMIHPLDNIDSYKILEDERTILEAENKYIDLDIMITDNSTLILDYYHAGYKGDIIQVNEREIIGQITDYEREFIIPDLDDLIEHLKDQHNKKEV